MVRYTPEGLAKFWHAPGADLDYGFIWSRGYLEENEVITDSAWVAPPEITVTRLQISDDGTVTSAFLAGAELGVTYTVVNNIITSDGRRDSRTLQLIGRYS